MAHARVHHVRFHIHGKPFWKALCNTKIVNLLEKWKGKEYNGCVFRRSGENGNVSINHNKTNALFVPKRCSKTTLLAHHEPQKALKLTVVVEFADVIVHLVQELRVQQVHSSEQHLHEQVSC